MKKNYYLISIFFIILAVKSYAQVMPKTPAAERVIEVIEILNGSSSFEISDYISTNYAPKFRDAFPIEVHKGMIERTQSMFGKLKVVEITKSTENDIILVLKSEIKDAWLNIQLQVDPKDAHQILMIGFRPASPPKSRENQTVISTLEELNKYLIHKSKEREFSGNVLIAKNGSPVFKEAYGFANEKNKILNEIDTKFNLGSINKIFTSVAIAQLMERGELSMEDPIGKYLDVFPPEIANKVTIRHLLNMKSGWGDYWSNKYFLAHKSDLKTVSDYMKFIKDIPLDFESGTSFQHCNIGYEVAGAIIEKISGMDYFDYIKKNIYEPAGMINSGSFYRDMAVKNRAKGYTSMKRNGPLNEACLSDNQDMLPLRGTPAGGGYSTVEDMLNFDKALRNNILLNTEFTQYIINKFKGLPSDPYTHPEKIYRVEGRSPGVITFLGLDFQSSYSIIVLSNYDNPIAMSLAEKVMELLDVKY